MKNGQHFWNFTNSQYLKDKLTGRIVHTTDFRVRFTISPIPHVYSSPKSLNKYNSYSNLQTNVDGEMSNCGKPKNVFPL